MFTISDRTFDLSLRLDHYHAKFIDSKLDFLCIHRGSVLVFFVFNLLHASRNRFENCFYLIETKSWKTSGERKQEILLPRYTK